MMRRQGRESTKLTDREHEVLLLLAEGLGAAAIGEKLYLSESTAKSHIARIYQKLGAANRAQALVTAMRIGLLSSVPRRSQLADPSDRRPISPRWGFLRRPSTGHRPSAGPT